jgi:hypothetical protein
MVSKHHKAVTVVTTLMVSKHHKAVTVVTTLPQTVPLPMVRTHRMLRNLHHNKGTMPRVHHLFNREMVPLTILLQTAVSNLTATV